MNKLNLKVYPIGGIITQRGSISSDLKTQRLDYTFLVTHTLLKKALKKLYKLFIEIILLVVMLVLLL